MTNFKIKSKYVLSLSSEDNIIISLKKMDKGHYLEDFDISINSSTLPGQKIAKVNIAKNNPIIKYGTTIGFADSNIIKGQVLTNQNVLFKEFEREHNYCVKYKPTQYVNLVKTFNS